MYHFDTNRRINIVEYSYPLAKSMIPLLFSYEVTHSTVSYHLAAFWIHYLRINVIRMKRRVIIRFLTIADCNIHMPLIYPRAARGLHRTRAAILGRRRLLCHILPQDREAAKDSQSTLCLSGVSVWKTTRSYRIRFWWHHAIDTANPWKVLIHLNTSFHKRSSVKWVNTNRRRHVMQNKPQYNSCGTKSYAYIDWTSDVRWGSWLVRQ